jgi:hypothetical protein
MVTIHYPEGSGYSTDNVSDYNIETHIAAGDRHAAEVQLLRAFAAAVDVPALLCAGGRTWYLVADDGVRATYSDAAPADAYKDYTTYVSDDPSYYGDPCSKDDATRIADSIAAKIRTEFPGINVVRYSGIGRADVQGPDERVCETISDWIRDNWTSAL